MQELANKTVAVLGAGNAGHAVAGHLALRGATVSLYNRWNDGIERIAAQGGIYLQQYVEGFGPLRATTIMAEAVAGADVVIITTPAFAHRFMSEELSKLLHSGQTVVFHPGHFGSSLELKQLLGTRDVDVTIIETATSIYSCRIVAEGRVNIRTMKRRAECAVYPSNRRAEGVSLMNCLFEDRCTGVDNVANIWLANIDPVYHIAPTALNTKTVLEGKEVPFYDLVTPPVRDMILELDGERLRLAGALGLSVPSFMEYLDMSYGVSGSDVIENIRRAYGSGKPSPAPTSFDHRFVTEAVPFGLVPWVSLGRALDVPTPASEAFITISRALTGEDYSTSSPRTLEKLGLGGFGRDELLAAFRGQALVSA